MTWRVPPYDRAVTEAEAFVRASWPVHGIVIAGSIMRGEAGPTSDLDVFVVHAAPTRVRVQKRFAGVPVELFVNPPERIRGYFESEHAEGKPGTAHMFATGEVLPGAAPILAELVAEARGWLARPLVLTPAELAAKRYLAVDMLDDARDIVDADPAVAALLVHDAVHRVIEYAFWQRGKFLPRRKDLMRALAALDPEAAERVRAALTARGADAVRHAAALADHVLGVDTFFEWSSDPE